MRAKYVLCPDVIMSKYDADRHYISACQLAALYRVSMSDCIIKDANEEILPEYASLPKLHPLFNGNYEEMRDLLGIV